MGDCGWALEEVFEFDKCGLGEFGVCELLYSAEEGCLAGEDLVLQGFL